MAAGHHAEELQDLLDRRVDERRRREIEEHLDLCPACRRELEALAWTKRMAGSARPADVPQALKASIQAALEREGSPGASRRGFLAATAAAVVLGSGGVLWLARSSRQSAPAAVARAYEQLRANALPLESASKSAPALETFFRERGLPFHARVLDLGMMGYALAGGRVHVLDDAQSALFVYRGQAGRTLLCQMYVARLASLPVPAAVHEHRGFRYQVYREAGITVVFWQEGAIVCALAGDFGEREVLALAFEKAML